MQTVYKVSTSLSSKLHHTNVYHFLLDLDREENFNFTIFQITFIDNLLQICK